jgi:hypothetical protein
MLQNQVNLTDLRSFLPLEAIAVFIFAAKVAKLFIQAAVQGLAAGKAGGSYGHSVGHHGSFSVDKNRRI